MSLEATKALPTQLKMKHTLENIDLMLERAMKEDMSCLQFLEMVLQKEVDYRQDKDLQTRMKQAQFPYLATLMSLISIFKGQLRSAKYSSCWTSSGLIKRTT